MHTSSIYRYPVHRYTYRYIHTAIVVLITSDKSSPIKEHIVANMRDSSYGSNRPGHGISRPLRKKQKRSASSRRGLLVVNIGVFVLICYFAMTIFIIGKDQNQNADLLNDESLYRKKKGARSGSINKKDDDYYNAKSRSDNSGHHGDNTHKDDKDTSNMSMLSNEPPVGGKNPMRMREANIEQKKRKNAIFFNTFVRVYPKDNEIERSRKRNRALGIINEQLEMIKSQPLLDGATIFYTRFGDLEVPWPNSNCDTCIQLASQEKGGEEITLQHLYEYCTENPLDRVLYMHSKGTYTPSKENDYLRNVLMKAITSDECLGRPGPADGACSSCSSKLFIIPVSHYSGNMWVSECDYVRKLIPPKDFELAKRNYMNIVVNATKLIEGDEFVETDLGDGPMRYPKNITWQNTRDYMAGIGRFAMEHWLGSHPDFKPCDVFGNYDIKYGMVKENQLLRPSIRYADNFTKKEFWRGNEDRSPLLKLEGKIYSFKTLYNKVPEQSSWMFSVLGSHRSGR